jgi:hypothetical protein
MHAFLSHGGNSLMPACTKHVKQSAANRLTALLPACLHPSPAASHPLAGESKGVLLCMPALRAPVSRRQAVLQHGKVRQVLRHAACKAPRPSTAQLPAGMPSGRSSSSRGRFFCSSNPTADCGPECPWQQQQPQQQQQQRWRWRTSRCSQGRSRAGAALHSGLWRPVC